MQLTVNNAEARILRVWLRLALDSALCGPSTEAIMSNTSRDPKVYQKYKREQRACDKQIVIIRGLLKRLVAHKAG